MMHSRLAGKRQAFVPIAVFQPVHQQIERRAAATEKQAMRQMIELGEFAERQLDATNPDIGGFAEGGFDGRPL